MSHFEEDAFAEGKEAFDPERTKHNPYEDMVDSWEDGWEEARREHEEKISLKNKPIQLTGHGAFRATFAHDCPNCGVHIPVGIWLEPYDYDDDGHSRTTPSEVIVCSATCKAKIHDKLHEETLALV